MKLVCPTCGESFSAQRNLNLHIKSHSVQPLLHAAADNPLPPPGAHGDHPPPQERLRQAGDAAADLIVAVDQPMSPPAAPHQHPAVIDVDVDLPKNPTAILPYFDLDAYLTGNIDIEDLNTTTWDEMMKL